MNRVFVITHFLEIYATLTDCEPFSRIIIEDSYDNDTVLDSWYINRDIILVTFMLVVVIYFFSRIHFVLTKVMNYVQMNGLLL